MECPHCRSQLVFRSRSEDHPAFRLLLCTMLRCHFCGDTFLAPVWKTAGQQIEPPPNPVRHDAA